MKQSQATPAAAPRRHLLLLAGLAALVLLAYSNSFSAGLIFDNRALILNDPRLR